MFDSGNASDGENFVIIADNGKGMDTQGIQDFMTYMENQEVRGGKPDGKKMEL